MNFIAVMRMCVPKKMGQFSDLGAMMMIRYMHTTLILFILSVVIARDRTTERRASGTDVVLASISKLQDTCIFANDFQFLRRIAWHETQDGIKG